MAGPTTNFFVDPARVVGETICLVDEEARHAFRVLRHRPGDVIDAVDGEGGWYRGRISAMDRSQVIAEVVETRREVGEASRRVELAVAVIKSRSRLDTLVEKATEIGVTAIRLMTTARTERPGVDLARLRRIAISALKQSGRSRLPELPVVSSLEDVVSARAEAGVFMLACHERSSEDPAVWDGARRAAGDSSCCVLIGPEGGFSSEETEWAADLGVRLVGLGPRRLRTETAGIVAAALLLTEGA